MKARSRGKNVKQETKEYPKQEEGEDEDTNESPSIQVSSSPTTESPDFRGDVFGSRDPNLADGTTDWMVAQRSALLAWTGHTLTVTPRIQRRLPLAHWGSSELTGRGLAALSAKGHIYQLTLAEGEEFVAHPSHVVAYTITKNPPLPFRFKSNNFTFQVPSVTELLGNVKFFQEVRKTEAYKFMARLMFGLRTTARRTIFGDRLFLQFRGPSTILMSSRGARISDVLSKQEVNEIADSPAGSVAAAVELATRPEPSSEPAKTADAAAVKINVASVGEDGKVKFEDAKNLKDFEK
ncbi:hypothetical protein DL767_000371 [Monosporascus sp. MG133]|nr:hypothetical protein DL767_000371 [Monosporascus sp. MG133]